MAAILSRPQFVNNDFHSKTINNTHHEHKHKHNDSVSLTNTTSCHLSIYKGAPSCKQSKSWGKTAIIENIRSTFDGKTISSRKSTDTSLMSLVPADVFPIHTYRIYTSTACRYTVSTTMIHKNHYSKLFWEICLAWREWRQNICIAESLSRPGPVSGIGISIIQMRRSSDPLIFIMGIFIQDSVFCSEKTRRRLIQYKESIIPVQEFPLWR